jgi:uncharacterized BrkB/YihY/UPF0761 family membrane protein
MVIDDSDVFGTALFLLWAYISALVFLECCKQNTFVYEVSFKRMR